MKVSLSSLLESFEGDFSVRTLTSLSYKPAWWLNRITSVPKGNFHRSSEAMILCTLRTDDTGEEILLRSSVHASMLVQNMAQHSEIPRTYINKLLFHTCSLNSTNFHHHLIQRVFALSVKILDEKRSSTLGLWSPGLRRRVVHWWLPAFRRSILLPFSG